ncbi:MAG: integration host factor subunit beta [Thiotrichales bacterium]|nr:MAG: integration host factor subunit beta [Thiotrichales bacterium]
MPSAVVNRSDIVNRLTFKLKEKYKKNPSLKKLTHHEVDDMVKDILYVLEQNILQKNRVEIRGFCSFELKFVAPHTARNPATGEEVLVDAKYKLSFHPSKKLFYRLNR